MGAPKRIGYIAAERILGDLNVGPGHTITAPGGYYGPLFNLQGGDVYFVNKDTGDNDNEGTDPKLPLADLEAAYLACADNKGDYIFAQRTWALTAPPLTIAKKRIHIIGLDHNPVGYWEGQAMIGAATASVEFAAESHEVELAGFCLGSPDAANPAVQIIAAVSSGHIHHCAIGQAGSGATYGIYTPAGGEMDDGWTIDHCEFGSALTLHHFRGLAYTARINNNVFRFPAAAKECIAVLGCGDVEIFGNMFVAAIGAGPAAGWAVHLDANAVKCFVYHNWAARAAQEHDAVNPYKDESTAGVATSLNAWADNFDGWALSITPDA